MGIGFNRMSGNTLFTSDKNYMKRNPASVPYQMLGPSVSRFGGSWYTSDSKVQHSIGRAPMFRLYYEPFNDGKIYEAFQDDQYYLSNPPNTYGGTDDGPTCLAWTDDTWLYVRLFFDQNIFGATNFNIYPVIYQDYGAA